MHTPFFHSTALSILTVPFIFFPTQGAEVTSDRVEIQVEIGAYEDSNPKIKDLLGVISGPTQPANSPAPDTTEALQDIGIRSIRNNDYYDDRMDIEGIFNCGGETYPSWEGCDAEDDQYYDWEKSDALFQAWINGKFEPFLRLGGEYQNGNPNHDFKGPQNTTQEDNWIIAAKKVVARYDQWDVGDEDLEWVENGHALQYVDIWTEWPSDHFYDGTDAEFMAFWAKAYQAIKEEYPHLKLGGPGLLGGVSQNVGKGQGGTAEEFLTYLYNQGIQPDWLGLHLFHNSASTYLQVVEGYDDLLTGEGFFTDVPWAENGFFDDTELIMDAYGMTTHTRVDGQFEEMTGEEKYELYNTEVGSSYLASFWTAMQLGKIERAYYYRHGDGESEPGVISDGSNKTAGGPGLFFGDEALTYKPTAQGVRLWSRVYTYFDRLREVKNAQELQDQGIWVLAVRNGENAKKAILISNTTDEKFSWTPVFGSAGKTISDFSKVKKFRVNDDFGGKNYTLVNTNSINLGPHTVQLVVFKK